MLAFKDRLRRVNPGFLHFGTLQTLQVNLGDLCNMRCAHCHVAASPAGARVMGIEVIDRVAAALARRPGLTLDVTGGCPEMNPHFRHLMEKTQGLSPRRIVRSNLTILTEPGYEGLPELFREHRLVVTASLPCYREENVELQRGKGAYARSIEGLKLLNQAGYGRELELNLVYNPGGDFIPGGQQRLEDAYRRELRQGHGIAFHRLFTLANAPIGRFREHLAAKGTYERYLESLADGFNPEAAGGIMCRTLVSVDWKGDLYNCDFNQALGLPITGAREKVLTVDDLEEAAGAGKELVLAEHCYCCTAGGGSSCTGALVA